MTRVVRKLHLTSKVCIRPSDKVICMRTEGFSDRFKALVEMATSTRHFSDSRCGRTTADFAKSALTSSRLRRVQAKNEERGCI